MSALKSNRWKSLKKKILKFNELYPEAHIICVAMVYNNYSTEGDVLMKADFANNPEVKEKYKNVLRSQTLAQPQAGQKRANVTDVFDLVELLQDHMHIVPDPPSKKPKVSYRSRWLTNTAITQTQEDSPSNFGSTSHTSANIDPCNTTYMAYTTSSSLHTNMTNTTSSSPCTNTTNTTSSPSTNMTNTTSSPCTNTTNTTSSSPCTNMTNTTFSSPCTNMTDTTSSTPPTNMANTSSSSPCTNMTNTTSSSTPTNMTNTTSSSPPNNMTNTSSSSPCPNMTNTTSSPCTNTTNTTSTSFCTNTTNTTSSSSCTDTAKTTTSSCTNTTNTTSSHTNMTNTTSPFPNVSNNELKQHREQLLQLAKESVERNDLQILRLLGAGNWNQLLALSEEVLSYLPKFPNSLAKEWNVLDLLAVDRRYVDFILPTVGARKCLQASANGNCIFNAFSIVLYGDESKAFTLRLACVVMMADRILEYSKYIAEEFGDQCTRYIGNISGDEYNIPAFSNEEKVEYVCQQELLLTAKKPYRDCTLFHIHMMANILQRPVINHFMKARLDLPFMQNIFPCLGTIQYPQPIHLVWVPSKPNSTHCLPSRSIWGSPGRMCI